MATIPNLPLAVGMPQWMGWLYGLLTAAAAVTDYRSGKIYNWLTLPALALGVVVGLCSGIPTLVAGLQGIALAAVVFVPMFFFGILGGGDVKLLIALGSILGAQGVFILGCITILIAGAGAVVLLFVHRRAGVFVRECTQFLRTMVTPGLQLQWPRLSREIKAPFGIAIFFALVYVLSGGLL